ncbi:hypothetical protein GCM10017673_33660 [Streptosporangium violaceochromogenes]|nr:hypothetical protein GCM10017673_33660 [Streptosporangium violaceochromogenes]
MSFFDKVKSLLGDHDTKVEDLAKQGIDKAARAAKERTGGKYDEHIDTAAAKAREAADKIDGRTEQEGRPGRTGAGGTSGEGGVPRAPAPADQAGPHRPSDGEGTPPPGPAGA